MNDHPDFQQRVARFVRQHHLASEVPFRVLDLASEVGEIAKEVLKASEYGARPFRPGANWADELGDALFSLICIANQSGVDLDQALQGALAKYQARLDRSGVPDSGR